MPELSSELDRPDELVHTDMDVVAGDPTRIEMSGGVSATSNGLVLKPEGRAAATFGEDESDAASAGEAGTPGVVRFELTEAEAVEAAITAARGIVDGPGLGEDDAATEADEVDAAAGHAEELETEAEQASGQDPPGGEEPPNGGGGEHGDGDNEGGEGRRLYTPTDVARHIARDRVVLSGVSPEVGRQNQELVNRFRQTAAEVGDSVIAVQFIGSRANGTSGLDSDLDAAVITFGDIDREEARQPFYDAADAMHVSADLDLAGRAASGIPDEVPEDPEEFLQWVEHGLRGSEDAPISLFDDGIYRTDDQLLLRLATVEVIGSYPYADQRVGNWQQIRDRHAAEYFGDLDRMRERLTQRLGAEHEEEVRRALSQQLMRERRERFGLPADMGAYQQRLARWATRNDARLQPTRGYRLLQAVRSAL